MNDVIAKQLAAVREVTDFVPRVALTLGSGLGGFADEIDVVCEIPYASLPEFPVSTAPGHVGKFILGYLKNPQNTVSVPVVCMQGRVHLYEGYRPDQVVNPLRLMHAMGAEILFLTNASGGMGEGFHAGTLAMVTDHISSFVPNPLIGPNDADEGVRFPDMTHTYDPELRKILQAAADAHGITLMQGVYCQLTGPSFETPAEIRMLKSLGADMVGMSTVVEAIVARHCGMRICCVSLIANLAAGISKNPLTEEEVIEAGREAAPKFTTLVKEAILHM